MRSLITKFVLPLLLIALLGGFSLVLASQEAGVSHGGEQVAAAVDGGHEATAAATHGETAVQEGHGAAEGGHGAEGAHAGKSITPEKLKDLFWRTVNFIALLVILIKFLAKPIGSSLSGRQQQVIAELEAIQAKRDTAERSYKEFESRLAGMEKEMEVVVQRAIAQAENEKIKILEDAEKAAEDIKRQAEAAIQAEIIDAKRKLRDDIVDQATVMAKELIEKNLTPDDQVKITEQYLDRIGAVQ